MENNSFSFNWAIFLQFCNILAISLTLFVLGNSKKNLFFGVFASIEVFQLMDLLLSFILKKKGLLTQFPEFGERRKKFCSFLAFLYRFPQVSLVILVTKVIDFGFSDDIGRDFLSIKLLGFVDLFIFLTAFKKHQMAIKIDNYLFLKMAENFMILIFMHHFIACIWLIVNKILPEEGCLDLNLYFI